MAEIDAQTLRSVGVELMRTTSDYSAYVLGEGHDIRLLDANGSELAGGLAIDKSVRGHQLG